MIHEWLSNGKPLYGIVAFGFSSHTMPIFCTVGRTISYCIDIKSDISIDECNINQETK